MKPAKCDDGMCGIGGYCADCPTQRPPAECAECRTPMQAHEQAWYGTLCATCRELYNDGI